jgi:DNA-binding MarR family transcriptional regulator
MTEAPQTTLDEETVIRLRSAVLRIGRLLRTASADEGLTPTQSAVLGLLVRRGPMRAGDVAAAEGINPTLLSRVLGLLEERGLVARRPDPEDGRSTQVRATAAGRRLVTRLRARRAALLGERLARLSPEELGALGAALPALEAMAEDVGA